MNTRGWVAKLSLHYKGYKRKKERKKREKERKEILGSILLPNKFEWELQILFK